MTPVEDQIEFKTSMLKSSLCDVKYAPLSKKP